METPLSDPAVARRTLDHARLLYQSLTKELRRVLEALESGEVEGDAKGRAETIRAHRKALQTVLDIETQFIANANDSKTVRSLDVEAARREILGRLDRLANEGGAGGAD